MIGGEGGDRSTNRGGFVAENGLVGGGGPGVVFVVTEVGWSRGCEEFGAAAAHPDPVNRTIADQRQGPREGRAAPGFE